MLNHKLERVIWNKTWILHATGLDLMWSNSSSIVRLAPQFPDARYTSASQPFTLIKQALWSAFVLIRSWWKIQSDRPNSTGSPSPPRGVTPCNQPKDIKTITPKPAGKYMNYLVTYGDDFCQILKEIGLFFVVKMKYTLSFKRFLLALTEWLYQSFAVEHAGMSVIKDLQIYMKRP